MADRIPSLDAIEAREVPAMFEYRARLCDGSWTAWSPPGTYFGTRAKAEVLLGRSVRLAGPDARRMALTVGGLFGTDPNPVVVGGGEECVHGKDPLCGIQVVVQAR